MKPRKKPKKKDGISEIDKIFGQFCRESNERWVKEYIEIMEGRAKLIPLWALSLPHYRKYLKKGRISFNVK